MKAYPTIKSMTTVNDKLKSNQTVFGTLKCRNPMFTVFIEQVINKLDNDLSVLM